MRGARRGTTGAGKDTKPAEPPVARNTLLLSASMAAVYGMIQLSAAIATVTFVAVTGVVGLAGPRPAIFLAAVVLTLLGWRMGEA